MAKITKNNPNHPKARKSGGKKKILRLCVFARTFESKEKPSFASFSKTSKVQ
ncbi:MAG: hypothetical protein ABWY22_05100 [Flavobacterium sp.]